LKKVVAPQAFEMEAILMRDLILAELLAQPFDQSKDGLTIPRQEQIA
jgi:hypothetical protein